MVWNGDYMEKFLEITYLYDFYGQLLTDKQNYLIKRYYLDDLSLGEIAIQENVSRQSIHNTIKQAENKLIGFENKLGLFARFKDQQNELKQIITALDNIKEDLEDNKTHSRVVDIIEHIQRILND